MVKEFGYLDNKRVDIVSIKNEHIEADIITYGATLNALRVKDKNGSFVDVCLGYDTLEEYISNRGYFGATVGRVANRIGGAAFTLNDEKITLEPNERKNSLHGGKCGFDKKVWDYICEDTFVTLSILSPDGDEGFPGSLAVSVTYSLKGSSLEISYKATTDKPTPISLTNHTYFNLGGHTSGDIFAHTLKINASRYTEVDSELIPTGKLLEVKGTALDFTEEAVLKNRLLCEELSATRGIDHNFVLNAKDGIAATLYCPETGIQMDTETTLEGLQIYSGGGLSDRRGKGGCNYSYYNAICLETQHFPDAINKSEFPSCVLNPDEVWEHKTSYIFSVR